MKTIELSDSLLEMLRDMSRAGDPIAGLLIRRRNASKDFNYWKRYTWTTPLSVGFVQRYAYPTRVILYWKKAARLSPPVEIGTHFSFREKSGMISYCPRGREQRLTHDGKWERAGRQDIKPAKWARSMLSPRALRLVGGDAALSAFAARFSAAEAATIMRVEPSDWKTIYNQSLMSIGVGSCMWNKPVGEFYRALGDGVAIPMIVTRGGKPAARFILWPKVIGEGKTISLCDRIYGSPSAQEHVLSWARENGHHSKTEQSTGCRYANSPDGSTLNLRPYHVSVTPFSPSDISFIPYLDTWPHGDNYGNGEISGLYCVPQGESGFEFTCTDGSFNGGPDDHEGQVQDVDGDWIDEDEAVEIHGVYYHRESSSIVYCEHGSCADEYILASDAYCVDLGGRLGTVWVHEDDVSRP